MAHEFDPGEARETFDTVVTLPTGITATGIAQECRDAAMVFVASSKHWGKAELGMWLTSTYANVTRHASRSSEAQVWPVPLLRDIDARLIDRIMHSAREEVIDTLAQLSKDASASFVLRALIAGTVVRCEDSQREPTWAPTGEASRLADRVLSLFAVDYLVRPADYDSELVVCRMCGTVAFDAMMHSRGGCDHGASESVVARPRHSTLPYPPMGA